MSTQMSPTLLTTRANPSRRRKWTEQTEQKHSKRIKTSSWPDLQAGTSPSDKSPFEDTLSQNLGNVPMPLCSSFSSSTYQTPFNETFRFPVLTRVIDLRQKSLEQNEDDTENEISRMVDLSTGESLEVIPSTLKQRKQGARAKRSLDQIVDEVEESMQTVSWALQTRQANPAVPDDAPINLVRPPNKKVRTLEQPTSSYIEEVWEDQETELFPQTYNVMEDLRLGTPSVTPQRSAAETTISATPSNDSTDSLSVVFQGRDTRKLEFTVPYKKAFADYMRSQLDYLKADGHGDDGKQVVLYRSNKAKYMYAFSKTDNLAKDSENKIQEIIDEEGCEEMLVDDVEVAKSPTGFEESLSVPDLRIDMMGGGQVGTDDRLLEVEQEMDIDC